MKRILGMLILAALVISFVGCTNSKSEKEYPPQSKGGNTVESTLNSYSKAFADIDYSTFTGYEILPYVTKEWGKTWLDELSSQYVNSYKNNKFVREFKSADISDVIVNGDSATATLVIHSNQKEPDEKLCASVPEKVTLLKVNGSWFVDKVEKK